MWTSTATSKYVTTVAESILARNMSQIESYASMRVNHSTFVVKRSDERKTDSLIPKFRRVYVVRLEDKYLKCSCKYHERNGLPCAHTGHVMKKHYIGWNGYTMYDISIFWWSIKLYTSSKIKMTKEIGELSLLVEEMEQKDSQGVYLHSGVMECDVLSKYQYGSMSTSRFITSSISDDLLKYKSSAMTYCMNYSENEISKCLADYSNYLFGISQMSHPDSSSKEEDDF